MRILLIGEFSRLHNSLKEGLKELGHEVLLVSTQDGFKGFPTDLNYQPKLFNSKPLHWLAKAIYRLTTINLVQIESAWRFNRLLPELKDYDVVQLINENSIKTDPKREIKLIGKLARQNKKLFLLSCGADYSSVKFAMDKGFRYSIMTPLLKGETDRKTYKFILRYLDSDYKKLHDFLFKTVSGVIATDLDYHLPLAGQDKYLGMISNPINSNRIEFKEIGKGEKLTIFHGVNSKNYVKKGNRFFDEALERIEELYPDKVEIIRTEDLPYSEYMAAYEKCDILMDMVYAYDQGYNALEAMARGKVVFTGAEKEWLEHYNLEADTVAINTLPDTEYLVMKLSWLIEDRGKLKSISRNARKFIVDHHLYLKVAERYLEVWNSV